MDELEIVNILREHALSEEADDLSICDADAQSYHRVSDISTASQLGKTISRIFRLWGFSSIFC